MADRVQIVCMKWGSKYDASYVNKLASMVRRHLARPHRFICFTDDPTDLDAGVERHPLPEVALPDGIPERGWRKLGIFQRNLADLQGSTLFLDLDVVIVDALDPFFEHPGRFCIIRDYKALRRDRYVGNSSVFRFEAGTDGWEGILETFVRDREAIRARFRNEQEYLSHYVHSSGALSHWPHAWCRSFKHDCMPGLPWAFFRTPRIPEGARIIVFHGHPHPDEAIAGRSGSWKRHVRPTPWVAEHWR